MALPEATLPLFDSTLIFLRDFLGLKKACELEVDTAQAPGWPTSLNQLVPPCPQLASPCRG